MSFDLGKILEVYVSWGESHPRLDLDAAKKVIADQDKLSVINNLESIVKELGEIQPNWETRNLLENSRFAADLVYMKHPDIGNSGRAALEWLYSWWWK